MLTVSLVHPSRMGPGSHNIADRVEADRACPDSQAQSAPGGWIDSSLVHSPFAAPAIGSAASAVVRPRPAHQSHPPLAPTILSGSVRSFQWRPLIQWAIIFAVVAGHGLVRYIALACLARFVSEALRDASHPPKPHAEQRTNCSQPPLALSVLCSPPPSPPVAAAMPASLCASARAKALRFEVAGKSAKQLEEWLRPHAPLEWARLKGSADRYPLMRAVEDRLEELRKKEAEDNGHMKAEEEEEEAEHKTRRSISHQASSAAAATSSGAGEAKKKRAATSAATTAAAPPTIAPTKRKVRLDAQDARVPGPQVGISPLGACLLCLTPHSLLFLRLHLVSHQRWIRNFMHAVRNFQS